MSPHNSDTHLYRVCEESHHPVSKEKETVIFSVHDRQFEALEEFEESVPKDVVLRRIPRDDTARDEVAGYRVIIREVGEIKEMRRVDSEKYKLRTELTPDSKEAQINRIRTMFERTLPVDEETAVTMTERIGELMSKDLDDEEDWSIEG